METWQKVLSGAACGIVGMVAMPVLAPFGAITAAGALIGAAVGGGAAYVASEDDDSAAEARGEARGRTKANAEHYIRLQQIITTLQRSAIQDAAQSHYIDVIHALIGVGMASAGAHRADSSIVMSVKEFACGQALTFLPLPVLRMIETQVARPPTLKSAYARARKVAPDDMAIFDEMVDMVETLAAPSGSASTTQEAANWRQLRAAA